MSQKVAVGVAGAALLGLGLYWFFNRQNQNGQPPNKVEKEQEQKFQEEEIKQSLNIPQLTVLAESINKQRPSEDQVIQLFKIIVKQSKARGDDFITSFRTERRSLLEQCFAKYIECVRDGLLKLKNIDQQAKSLVLEELGMSDQQYKNAQMRYGQAFQQTESQIMYGQDNYLSLDEVQRVINFQKDYLVREGQRLLTRLQRQTAKWSSQQRELIYQILNTLIIDEVFAQFQYQQDLIQRSIIKSKNEVIDEIMDIRDILTQFFMKLCDERDMNTEQEQDLKLDAKLMRNLSGQPQFQNMMNAMHEG